MVLLAIVDDLDGDGTAELLVGAAQRRTGAATGGSVFLALGTNSGPDLATAQELVASDVHRAQRFGQSVASVGRPHSGYMATVCNRIAVT